jgi:chromosome segregation protein
MFLKSLALRGFKSFAERTDIELRPGVTVIVGPNGSGKSNLVDALAWVFGTQGPKLLRGQKMEDVIFAGTPERPALGRAEVSITIDNAAGLLPVDAAEITISRLLFRSGEAEYAMNGAPCRLLDIQDVLSDTGVGRQLHVLVGQGQIDSILSAHSSDRRAVIEEAAGILKHRRRKEKALRRLDSMEANLQRLSDLSRELRRQLRPLQRQADAARQHAKLREELESLQRFLAGRELAALQARAEEAATVRQTLEERRDSLRSRRDQIEATLGKGSDEVAVLGGGLEAARDLEGRLRSVAERLSSLARLATERSRTAALQREVLSRPASPGEVGGRTPELKAESVSLDTSITRSLEEAHRLEDRLRHLASVHERDDRERARLRSEIEKLDASSTPLSDELARLEKARERSSDEVARLEERWRSAETQVYRLRGDLEARKAAIEHAREGSPGRRAASSSDRVAGLLSDLVVVDPEAQAAVIAILGPELGGAAVSGSVEDVFAELKGAGVGAAVLVSLEGSKTAPDVDADRSVGAPLLLSSVRPAPGPHAAEVARFISAHLRDVYLCVGWRTAWSLSRRHPRLTFVTTEGDVVRSGGPYRLAGEEVPDLLRSEAVVALEASLRSAERALYEVATSLERRRQEMAVLVEEEIAAKEALHEADAMLTSAAGSLARVERQRQELQSEESLLSEHLAEVERRRRDDTRRKEELLTEISQLEEQPEITDRGEAQAAALAAAEVAQASAGAIARRAGRAAEIASRRAERATVARGAQGESVKSATQRVDSAREALREASRELEMIDERLRRAELDDAETRLRLEAAQQVSQDLGGAKDRADLEHIDLPEGMLPEEVPGRIRNLKDDIARLGPINPLALEEQESISGRYEFLVAQLDDVRSSRRELTKVIHAVDAKIIEIFSAAFEDVAHHFSDIFGRLFPGGSGRLFLSDPADLLESGIDIEARPAGKRVDRLSLLSGGERSLAALAFLFAVFRARPSPFYVLDEVEAALDDVNLHRFIGLLEEFRDEAQLLVVTHQKRTMECADCLYGVSMRDDGTTRVISQRMSELDALAAASST